MIFQLSDIPRLLPELLLCVLALLVLGSDVFTSWQAGEEGQLERGRELGTLALTGLMVVFAVALIQSGYLYRLPEDAPVNPLTNILRNLQAGGPAGEPILGAFATDHLTMIARLIFIGAALLTVLLALDYQPRRAAGEFYALLLFATAGMNIMAAANELITAYLGLELASLALYVLAGYFRSDPQSAEAGMKYFVFGALSSGILLYGMSLAYGFTAATLGLDPDAQGVVGAFTQFDRIAQAVAQATPEGAALLTLALVFILAGVGYKIAVVPFHAWAPDVYQGAPTVVTAFIATASKTAGFLLLYRLLTVAFPGLAELPAELADTLGRLGNALGGWTGALALLALLTIVFGNLAALPQTNAKRLLAYSSIAHAGFLLLGFLPFAASDGPQWAASSLLYYLVVYTVTNIGAFGALALVDRATGGDDLADLAGLAQRNLGLAALLTVFVLSLAGIPPLSGFFAKFYVFLAAWRAGETWLVVVAVLATIVALYYYLRIIKAMFVDAPASVEPLPMPRSLTTALLISLALVVAMGLFPNLFLDVLNLATAPVAATP
jgi:proton-translocating NADH-quinone oxidoreductase chain N